MARPVETDDDALLEAAGRVLMSVGPADFTLSRAGAEAGVSAATLIKRFGSKHEIFVRLSKRWVASLDRELREAAAATDGSPLTRLRAVALHSYHDLDNPATASNQLAALAIDLQHQDMRELLDQGWGHVRRHLARHARAAGEAGQLQGGPPPAQLARIVLGAMEGGALAWSVHPRGSLITLLGRDLDALLRSWAMP